MTINTEFFDWQRKADDPKYNRASPNLLAIQRWLADTFGMTSLGIYGERAIRAGVAPSSHSHGAALDSRYGEGADRRELALDLIIPTLINNSAELGISAIHDYIGSRIWRAGRNNGDPSTWWIAQAKSTANGMGQSWAVYLHIETTLNAWGDARPVDSRFGAPAPATEPPPLPAPVVPAPLPPAPPAPAPAPVPASHPVLRLGDNNDHVLVMQTVLRDKFKYAITADGRFGPKTHDFVVWFQATHGLVADGLVGKNTWAVLLA